MRRSKAIGLFGLLLGRKEQQQQQVLGTPQQRVASAKDKMAKAKTDAEWASRNDEKEMIFKTIRMSPTLAEGKLPATGVQREWHTTVIHFPVSSLAPRLVGAPVIAYASAAQQAEQRRCQAHDQGEANPLDRRR
jgi:hypothetical protein